METGVEGMGTKKGSTPSAGVDSGAMQRGFGLRSVEQLLRMSFEAHGDLTTPVLVRRLQFGSRARAVFGSAGSIVNVAGSWNLENWTGSRKPDGVIGVPRRDSFAQRRWSWWWENLSGRVVVAIAGKGRVMEALFALDQDRGEEYVHP
jgi:hypothetical protein